MALFMNEMSFITRSLSVTLAIILLLEKPCYASRNAFVLINQCPCHEQEQVYQCTIRGRGATVWRGTAFECLAANNKIVLFHNINSTVPEMCNNGAILGVIFRAEGNCYTSQLTIRADSALDGRSIICAHDNGSVVTMIGSAVLNVDTEPYPPPTDVHLVQSSPDHLTFQWSPVTSNCQAVNYGITTTNCGECPVTTQHTTVSCSQFVTNNKHCTLAVQTIACGNVAGNISREISVLVTVPAAPEISVIPIYSYTTQNLNGLVTTFRKEDKINISEGVDGSALSYTVNYTESDTAITCATATILSSSCFSKVFCEHVFKVASSSCPSVSRITVTVAGNGRLGKGRSSNPFLISETTNQFVSLTFDKHINPLTCKFLHQPESQFANHTCSIVYGTQEENCRVISLTGRSNFSSVYIGIPSRNQVEFQREQCFTVTAKNGTYTAMIVGSFATNCNPNLLAEDVSDTNVNAECHPPLIIHSFSIQNGIVCYTGTNVGSTAYYYCLICGDKTVSTESISERTCMIDGSWNGSIPQCRCVSRPFIVGGTSFRVSVSVLSVLIIAITATFIIILVTLLHSNRALRRELFQAKLIEPTTLYEDIDTITMQPPPLPDFNTGKNAAYSNTDEEQCNNE